MRIGIHCSTSGVLQNAAKKAIELGANCLQIFSSSPRMWAAPMPRAAEVAEMKRLRAQHDIAPLVIHDSYLINLASVDPVIRAKSIHAFRGEVERAVIIGAEYLVAHPGSFKDQTVELGIASFIEGLREAVAGVDTDGLTLLLENTAGQGAALGSKLEELAEMKRLAADIDIAIGYCIDTCHLLAAGYDVASEAGLKQTVKTIDRVLGLANVPVIHTNDSKTPLGSHRDRHENIGEGFIGDEGFRRILTHPKLRKKAFILETPIDNDGDDRKNVDALKRLSKK